LQIKSPRFFTF